MCLGVDVGVSVWVCVANTCACLTPLATESVDSRSGAALLVVVVEEAGARPSLASAFSLHEGCLAAVGRVWVGG